MPNSSSAKKRVRQTEVRTLRNKARRSTMRSMVRQVQEAVEAKDAAKAQAALQQAYKQIDKAAKANILHANTAANHKSRLAKQVRSIS